MPCDNAPAVDCLTNCPADKPAPRSHAHVRFPYHAPLIAAVLPAHDAPRLSAVDIHNAAGIGALSSTKNVLRLMRADGLVDADEVPGRIGRHYRKAPINPSTKGKSNGTA